MDWFILGIEPTKDKTAITNAYRNKLRQTNPEDKPEEFKALRLAYEEALRLASPRPHSSSVTPEVSCAEAVLLAQRAMARDNPEGALRALSRCEEKSGEWYYMQGKVLMALEEYESAHQAFREAVRTSPDNNVYREGALDAAVASQKAATIQGKAKKVLKNLFRK